MHIAYGSTYWYSIEKRIGSDWLKRIGNIWLTELPRSGKKVWIMKKIPGQGKVREFHFQSGKLRKMKKVREKSGNFKLFKKVDS